jgi:Tol biopolymer transport system component
MPSLSADGQEVYFSSNRSANFDLYRALWNGTAFANAVALTELNTPSDETGPAISSDRLSIVFDSNRAGGQGLNDLYVATRTDPGQIFATTNPLAASNSPFYDQEPGPSPDGTFLAFCTDRPEGDIQFELWGATAAGGAFPNPAPLEIEADSGGGCGPTIISDGSLLFHSSRPGGLGQGDLYLAPLR